MEVRAEGRTYGLICAPGDRLRAAVQSSREAPEGAWCEGRVVHEGASGRRDGPARPQSAAGVRSGTAKPEVSLGFGDV